MRMTRGVEGRGAAGRGKGRGGWTGESDRCLPSEPSASRNPLARAVAAVMAAHANQHGAETPSLTSHHPRAYVCTQRGARRGRRAAAVNAAERRGRRVHAARVAPGSCFTHAKREPSTDRPKDRLGALSS